MTLEALLAEVQSPCLVCGEFPMEVRQQILNQAEARLVSPAASVRRPGVLAELAWTRWQSGQVDEEAALAPIYLHIAEPVP